MSLKGIVALSAAIASAVVLAGAAVAGQPVFERIQVDESGIDTGLTAACGFEVTFAVQGHVIVRSWPDRDKGTVELTTIAVGGEVSANGNSIHVNDVGNDHVRVAPDGTVILSIVGQVPFQFSGALKINLTTGEVFHEPHHIVDIDAVCARLAA